MTPERWEQIKEIFESALRYDGPDRTAFIRDKCHGDSGLQEEIDRLLATGMSQEGFLDIKPIVFSTNDAPSEEQPAIFSEGQIIAQRYRVISRIGRGGMSEVYEADDLTLNSKIAIKTIRPEIARIGQMMTRFRREIQLSRRVTHRNVCRVYDVGSCEGSAGTNTIFLTMELLKGETLASFIRNRAPLGNQEALLLIEQMAEALAAAHRVEVVHRDFKPGNVILVPDDDKGLRAVVTDFGIACSISDDATTSAGRTIVGTPLYMAPEQLRGEPVTPATDIYAFGLVVLELLRGNLGPYSPVIAAVQPEVQREADLDLATASLSPRFRTIITRCLDPDMTKRFQTASELLSAFTSQNSALPTNPAGKRFRRTAYLALSGAAAVALVFAAWFALYPVNSLRLSISQIVPLHLQERSRVLVADFENRTGEPVFDPTLREIVSSSLEQSRWLELFPAAALPEVLQRMERPSTVRIDESLAEEICLREGLAAVVVGSISKLGAEYVVTLRTLTPDGKALFSGSERARDQSEVLTATDRLVARTRNQLGESFETIRAYQEPLERVTSSSLEALRLYSLGRKQMHAAEFKSAGAFFERATELDPQFAMAYAAEGIIQFDLYRLGDAQRALERALQLSVRLTERERRKIQGDYYFLIAHDLPKAIEEYQFLLELYPDDYGAHTNLGQIYERLRRFSEAFQEAQKAIQLIDSPVARNNLAYMYLHSGDLKRALETESGILSKFPGALPRTLYQLGMFDLINGDFFASESQFQRLIHMGGPGEAKGLRAMADLDMTRGRYHRALDEMKSALAKQDPDRDSGELARTHLQLASLMADISDLKAARDEAREAVRLAQEPELLGLAATVVSRIEDRETLAAIVDRLQTAGDQGPLALARAELLGVKREYAGALEILNSTAGNILLTEAKARICEKDHRLAEAAAAYQQIVDYPSERAVDLPDEPAFHRIAEAYYHLGILYTQLEELDQARFSLDRYLAFLQDPDADFTRMRDAQTRRLELSAPARIRPTGGIPRLQRK